MSEDCPFYNSKQKIRQFVRVIERSIESIESFTNSDYARMLEYIILFEELKDVFSHHIESIKSELCQKIMEKQEENKDEKQQ